MTDKSTEEILKRIDALAAKLGVTAEYVWAILLKQAHVQIFTTCFEILLLGAIAYWASVLRGRISAKNDGSFDDVILGGGRDAALYVLSWVAIIVLVPVCIFDLLQLPTLIANPEYWALTRIVK